MKIRVFPGLEIPVRTGLGVIYNALCACLVALVTAVIWAAAGYLDFFSGYVIASFFVTLGALVWGRFLFREHGLRASYEQAYEYLIHHLPRFSRNLNALLRVRLRLVFALLKEIVTAIESDCTALAHRLYFLTQRANEPTALLRHFILTHASRTHAPPTL